MRSTRRTFLMGAAALSPVLRAQAGPTLKVESMRRLFHNGEHNAFTDLVRFRDRLYVTFRSCPDGHMVHPTSSILVLASDDGGDWREVHRFSVPLRDVRDPHFLVFDDKLFVYSGTWYCGESSPERYDMNQQLGYGIWSADGRSWSAPRMLEGTYGHYVWRAAAHGGRAYLCGRRKRGFAETTTRQQRDPLVQSALLESDDGLRWRTAGLFQQRYGNETAFLFEPDGSLLAVARGGGNRDAELIRSRAPFDEWTRTSLGRYIGGPLLVDWAGMKLVGGRKLGGGEPRTVLWRLVGDELEPCAELPSGGDNSYPGFVELSPTRALLTYYSTHEHDRAGKSITAIYLAELSVEAGDAGAE